MMYLVLFALQLILGIATYLAAEYKFSQTLLVAGILAGVLYASLAYYELKREKWIISPLVAYLGISVLYIGSASIWAYLCDYWETGDYNVFQVGFLDIYNSRPYAVAYGIIGSSFFYLGYHLVLNTRLLNLATRIGKRTPDLMIPLPVLLLIIALAYFIRKAPALLHIDFNVLGAISNNIALYTTIGVFIILTSNVAYAGRKAIIKPAGWHLYLALLVALIDLRFNALRSGMRAPMMMLIIFFAWGYLLQNNIFAKPQDSFRNWLKKSKSALILASLSILTLLVIVPFGKQIARGGSLPTESEFTRNIIHWKDEFPNGGIWTLPARMAASSIKSLAACIELREMVPPDRTVLYVVSYGVIPRLIWPEKPYVSQSASFTLFLEPTGEYGTDETQSYSSTGLTAIGELYWSYGTIGVLVGMLIIGLAFGFTFTVFSYNLPLNPVRYVVVCVLVFSACKWFEAEASAIYNYIIFIWVVFFPMLWMVTLWLPFTTVKTARAG
ncbi:MAG TPA: hypothetical protein VM658_06440 [bacterium]|nr:hypothetical protein [bacterium]